MVKERDSLRKVPVYTASLLADGISEFAMAVGSPLPVTLELDLLAIVQRCVRI